MKAPQECCVVFQAPVPFRSLVRINVFLKDIDPANDNGGSQLLDLHSRAKELCERLNLEQPGGPLVAIPSQDPTSCTIVCNKVRRQTTQMSEAHTSLYTQI